MKLVDICPKCSKSYSYRGIKNHISKCKSREPEKLNIKLKNDDTYWRYIVSKELRECFYQFSLDDETNGSYKNSLIIQDMSCYIDDIDN